MFPAREWLKRSGVTGSFNNSTNYSMTDLQICCLLVTG